MNETRSHLIMSLFVFVPYLLVSWAYMIFISGDSGDFWRVLGLLVAVRLFFCAIESLGSVVSWRLYGKSLMVNKFVEFLRANDLPRRKYAHDDFLNYLARIEDEPAYPTSLKAAAKEIYFVLSTFESMGILLGMRMHSASEAALDIHSPKGEAPIYGATAV